MRHLWLFLFFVFPATASNNEFTPQSFHEVESAPLKYHYKDIYYQKILDSKADGWENAHLELSDDPSYWLEAADNGNSYAQYRLSSMHSLSNGWKGIEPSKERAEYWMKRAIESKYPLAVVRKFRKQGTWRGDEKIIAVTTELADSGNTLAASALARRLAKQKKFDLAIKYALLSNSHGTGLFVMKSLFKEKYRMKHPSLEHANLYLKFAELGADYYKKYTGDQFAILDKHRDDAKKEVRNGLKYVTCSDKNNRITTIFNESFNCTNRFLLGLAVKEEGAKPLQELASSGSGLPYDLYTDVYDSSAILSGSENLMLTYSSHEELAQVRYTFPEQALDKKLTEIKEFVSFKYGHFKNTTGSAHDNYFAYRWILEDGIVLEAYRDRKSGEAGLLYMRKDRINYLKAEIEEAKRDKYREQSDAF